ncbi:MAG TPA: ATP-binding protein [Ignavibacteria bacterium]
MASEIQIEENMEKEVGAVYPQIEQFIESRENYIKALEKTIELLEKENRRQHKVQKDIERSIDDLLTFQKMANTISSAQNPDMIMKTLSELSNQVIHVIESNIYLLKEKNLLHPLLKSDRSNYLDAVAQKQLEQGIIDWVMEEKKTVIIPDLDNMLNQDAEKNFIIVPIVLLNQSIGFYIIHTDKQHKKISEHDLQRLSILTNNAAIAIQNYNINRELIIANENLKISQAKMIQVAKLAAVGELSGGLAHEINNPLQILLGHVQLLQVDQDLPRRIEIIKEQIERISNITKRLLNFSRVVPGEFKSEPVPILEALDEILSLVDFQLRDAGINLHKDYKCKNISVIGNKIYLQQVFLNIILNAKDALPNGGNITISSEIKDEYVLIKFTDDGVGIAPQNLSKIFSPFFSTKESKKGMGLGLSNSRWIILKHKGDIQVESKLNEGTTFSVYLPYVNSFKLKI